MFQAKGQRGTAPVDRGKRVAAIVHQDDTLEPDQSTPSFTSAQYAKLITLPNKHDLETSPSTPNEAASAAMLVGKMYCFSTSKPELK